MAFDWLDSVGFFTIDLGLDRVRELLDRLGSPERNLRFIHVAGSNGKGSVCTFLENGLRACGFSTGFYSSPHLIRLAERYRINGTIVDDPALESAADEVRPVVEAMRGEGRGPTYFEITTALALVLFSRKKVDFVVWETGLGGRLDATNVVLPVLSVITGISLEHTEYLGSTLAAVAAEKAGITEGSIFVTKSGRPVDRSNVLHEMKNLAEAAGVERGRIFPHNLRHLFAYTYYQTEKDIVHLADLLGHASVNTTRIYTMTRGREQAEQIGQLGLLWEYKKTA